MRWLNKNLKIFGFFFLNGKQTTKSSKFHFSLLAVLILYYTYIIKISEVTVCQFLVIFLQNVYLFSNDAFFAHACRLTDFHLSLYPGFTSITIVYLGCVVSVHGLDKLTRNCRVLEKETYLINIYNTDYNYAIAQSKGRLCLFIY